MSEAIERFKNVLAKAIAKKVQGELNAQVEFAKVKSVEGDGTCTVQMLTDKEGVTTDGILTSLYSNMKMKPKVGSYCLVAHIMDDDSAGFIIWSKEIEEVSINGDAFGGIAKTKEIAERLDRVEKAVTALQSKYNTHTHTYANVGVPTPTTPPLTPSTEVLTPGTTQEYISNTTVKHGNG